MVVRRSPKPLTGVRSPLPLLIKDLDFQGPFLLILIFSFSHRKSDFLFNHIFNYAFFSLLIAFLVALFIHSQLNSIKYYNCGQTGDSTHTASGIWHPFGGFFQFWHARALDHKQDLRGKRHPFWDFFIFCMPSHPITSRIYAANGILFGIFSFFACRGTRS